MRFVSSFLSIILVPLIAVLPLRAELNGAPANSTAGPTTPAQSNQLRVRLADLGKSTVEANSIMTGYAVQVTDSSGLPVSDAAVAIRFPDEGPTGYFVNGEHSGVAYTDVSGVAKFPQVNWGATPGTVAIRVTAVKGDLRAGALIEQVITEKRQASAPTKSAATTPITASAPTANVPTSVPAPVVPNPAAPAAAAANTAKTPGVPTSITSVHSGATPEEVAKDETPATPVEPSVSVVNTAGNKGKTKSNTTKWLILAAVIAGAGVGAALAMAGKGGSSTTTTAPATTTIGTPTISLGH